MNLKNPWSNLSVAEPYIASVDKDYFLPRLDSLPHLKFQLLPEPYLGCLETAKVVLLALNPGFQESDLMTYQNKNYAEQNRLNLVHQSTPPFYSLSQDLSFSGAYKWWTRILKALLDSGIPLESLSSKLFSIQYFPYHSVTYTHMAPPPSQAYSFDLLRLAIKQKKQIVVMRSERLWLEAVPELISSRYIKLKNPRNPVISPNNMSSSEFDLLKRLLES